MFLRAFIAGYVACIVTIAAIGVLARALSQTYAVATVGSHHFDRDKDYKEDNLGLGVEHRLSDDWSLSAGFYRNSFDRHTNYMLAGYTPFQIWGWRAGAVVGGVTGYSDGITPWVSGIATRDFGPAGVNVVFSPAGIALQIKFRFPNHARR